jgi:aryl-alcohol dehydrogenase-like predicted oxidoreductase
VKDILGAAREVGVTLLDTADTYGGQGASETLLGQALHGQRDHFVVATKFGMSMAGLYGEDFGARGARRYVRRAVEGSLRRLQTDHIDLYQLHRPDPVTPIEETLSVLTDLVREGSIGYLGCSNFDGWQLADADWAARTAGLERFVSVQNQYSLLTRDIEDEVVPAAEHYGIGVLPFFPLEAGLLTGKYKRGQAAPAGTRFAVEAGRGEWLENADWDRI